MSIFGLDTINTIILLLATGIMFYNIKYELKYDKRIKKLNSYEKNEVLIAQSLEMALNDGYQIFKLDEWGGKIEDEIFDIYDLVCQYQPEIKL